MSAREFAEWIAYARITPFGEARNDQRAGAIASAIVNVHLKRGAKHLQWNDFFPTYDDRNKTPLQWEDMLAQVEALNEALGGSDIRKKT